MEEIKPQIQSPLFQTTFYKHDWLLLKQKQHKYYFANTYWARLKYVTDIYLTNIVTYVLCRGSKNTCLFKTAYFKTRLWVVWFLLLLGFLCSFWLVFWFFVCFWHDRAARILCFLTLLCQRPVIGRDSTLALCLPAWILRGWERLLTFRAWLSGEEYFTLALTMSWKLSVLESFSLINPKSRVWC